MSTNKHHNNSGSLREGSIESTQFTQKLAHVAWYCKPPYVNLTESSSLLKSLLFTLTSNKHTPHALIWSTLSSDLIKQFLKLNMLSSGWKRKSSLSWGLELGLWCFMPLSSIFQLYRGGQFYWWRKPEYPEKKNQPVASHWQTLSHNVVSSTPHHERDSNSSLGLFVFIFPYQWTMLVKYPLKYASKIVLYMLSIHIFKYLNRPITMIITNINSSSNQISK
jgi:hypothetical protein